MPRSLTVVGAVVLQRHLEPRPPEVQPGDEDPVVVTDLDLRDGRWEACVVEEQPELGLRRRLRPRVEEGQQQTGGRDPAGAAALTQGRRHLVHRRARGPQQSVDGPDGPTSRQIQEQVDGRARR